VRASDVVFGRRRSLVARIQDGSGTITLRFFHFSAAQKTGLKTGTRLRCFGQVRRGSSGLEMFHPEYRALQQGEQVVEEVLTPIYPTTAGIGQNQWRNLCGQALSRLRREPPRDLLPQGHNPYDLGEALAYLHAAGAPQVRHIFRQSALRWPGTANLTATVQRQSWPSPADHPAPDRFPHLPSRHRARRKHECWIP